MCVLVCALAFISALSPGHDGEILNIFHRFFNIIYQKDSRYHLIVYIEFSVFCVYNVT